MSFTFSTCLSQALRSILLEQLPLSLCTYTWLLARGCVYPHTEGESKPNCRALWHECRVSRVRSSAPRSRQKPGVASRRFLLASSRTALEQCAMMKFSCLCIAASGGNSSPTTLPWVGDKILSLVPLSLHVWVVLQQQWQKCCSDLTPVPGGVSHPTACSSLHLTSILKHKSSYITFTQCQTGKEGGFVIASAMFCNNYCSFAIIICNNAAEVGTHGQGQDLFSVYYL